MKSFPLKIVTPDGVQFDGMAQELIVRTTTGDLGILAGHINCTAPLGMGTATVMIDGVKRFTGAEVYAPDLRAGAALVMAGLAAEGCSVVEDIHYILRGYENFEGKLRDLGAEIHLADTDKEVQKYKLSLIG